MNKAKSCSGALVGANCKCIFAGELFEDPQRRTGYLGSMDYQTTRGETTLEVNRSGTCLTRGHQEGQQVVPKHKSKSRSSCLWPYTGIQFANFKRKFIQTNAKRFSHKLVLAKYRLKLKHFNGVFVLRS